MTTLRIFAGFFAVFTLVSGANVWGLERTFPTINLPSSRMSAQELGVIVNDSDPLSIKIGAYYTKRRGLPAANVIHVTFPSDENVMDEATFLRVKARVDALTPADVQGFALAWTRPFRVGCMSITNAFSDGFDKSYCAAGCAPTKRSSYFASRIERPFDAIKLRPSMMLAGTTFASVKALIDRGIRSDNTWPQGSAYLIETRDKARNVRALTYQSVRQQLARAYLITIESDGSPSPDSNVMFYFTGAAEVLNLQNLVFDDGAIADHLTSFGGVLFDGPQMSSLQWLQAGATGSYGTVQEPCNYLQKFPNVGVVMSHYLAGETLLEAYWKGVEMPGQGLFVGEPLAHPFGGMRLSWIGKDILIRTRSLWPGIYSVQEKKIKEGQFHQIATGVVVGFGIQRIRISSAHPDSVYRIVPMSAS